MLFERMLRAARLDPELYYELRRDGSANGQAFEVVLIAFAAALVGGGLRQLLHFLLPPGWIDLLLGMGYALMNWLFWCWIAEMVGRRFGSRADFEQILRPVGFAYAPGILRALTLFSGLAPAVNLIVFLWIAVGCVLAVREAMQLNTRGALQTAVLTTVFVVVIDAVISLISGHALSLVAVLPFGLGR
jgi:Yip1-like protein